MPDEARTLELNFLTCEPKQERVYVSLGSSAYQVQGKTGDFCVLRYGGEVENPNWDGKLTTECQIPTSVGLRQFPVKELGVDFSSIRQYCNDNAVQKPNYFYTGPIIYGIFAVIGIGVLFLAFKRFQKWRAAQPKDED